MRGDSGEHTPKNILLKIRSEDLHKAGSLELPSLGAVDMLGGVLDGKYAPSSLMVVEPKAPLLAAALGLDAKLQALAAKVTTKATGRKASMQVFKEISR